MNEGINEAWAWAVAGYSLLLGLLSVALISAVCLYLAYKGKKRNR
jgi:Flp pilus assembly pilin Flp